MSERALTPRQKREVDTALRHLGRAMGALGRVDLPLARAGESWLFPLNKGERLVGEASNSLIDGLEILAGTPLSRNDAGQ
jgi:hypothetical protein